jgi:hypothetical protein
MRTVELGGPGVHLPTIRGAAYLPLHGLHECCRLASMWRQVPHFGGRLEHQIPWELKHTLTSRPIGTEERSSYSPDGMSVRSVRRPLLNACN